MSRRHDRPCRRVVAAALWVIVSSFGCAEVCETGEVCARTCPPGGAAVCAAHGLCSCLRAPDDGLPDALMDVDGPAPSAAEPSDPANGESESACPAPGPGELVINEVMLDGEPTEDAEFVELLNRTGHALNLGGVTLTSNRGADQVRRVAFVAGCLPADSALAVFSDRSAWIESTPAAPPIDAELRSFGFANGGDFDFRLLHGETLLDRFEGQGDVIEPGISLNRAPDGVGPPRAHAEVDASSAPSSPGRCPGGGRYEEGCARPDAVDPVGSSIDAGVLDDAADVGSMPQLDGGVHAGGPPTVDQGVVFDCPPAEPGELRINEVLIDGVVPRTEADEFVEIVNRAPAARRLQGVALAVEAADGALDVRVRFADGCLPPAGVMVLRPDPADWLFDPVPMPAPIFEDARLALGNESRHPLLLLGPGERMLDRFEPDRFEVVEGVSLNRDPEVDGERWSLHDTLAATASSPGRCSDGSRFASEGCPPVDLPPEPACADVDPTRLVINEVLVDGLQEGEVDEFVELVNPGQVPVALSGLSLWSSRADGQLIERTVFDRGCLQPGALTVFGDRVEAHGAIDVRVTRLALPNEAAVIVELRTDDVRWSVELAPGISRPGVSRVRQNDGDPDADWQDHDAASGLRSSPGLRSDGSPFAGSDVTP